MHSLRAFSISLVCVLFAPVVVDAQQPQRDQQALELLTQAFILMGGSTGRQLTDARVEGYLALPSAPDAVAGTFVAKVRGADLSVETYRNGERTSFRVLRGRGSTQIKGATKTLPPYNTYGLSLDIIPLFSRSVEFLQADASVRLLGTADLEGIPCQLIRIERKPQGLDLARRNEHGTTDLFLDSRTGLVAAIRFRATEGRSPADQVTIENRFYDYHDYNGFLIPNKVARHRDSQLVIVLHLTAVQFNNGFTDVDFQQ